METPARSAQKRKDRAGNAVANNQLRGFYGAAFAIFFLVYYVFIALWAEPRVQYFGRPAAFRFDERFFQAFLIRPGGLVEYVASGLHQCYQYTWLGAAVTTGIAGLFAFGTWLLLARIGRGPVRSLCLWPTLGLLLIERQYSFARLEVTLALLGAVWLAAGYVWLPMKNVWQRWLAFVLLAAPAYALLAGASLAFAFYCGLLEIVAWRRYLLALALWVVAAVLPYGGAWFFSVQLWDAYLLLLPFGLGEFSPYIAAAIYAGIPLAVLARAAQSLVQPELMEPRSKRPRGWGWRPLVEPALLILIIGAVVRVSWNGNTQRLARINCLSHDRLWSSVLEQAHFLSAYNPSAISHINRALCQTGRLSYEMFRYPQKEEYDFWITPHNSFAISQCMVASDLLFEIGQVNRAERMAGEALELNGYLPDVLKRLADVNVLRGDLQAAGIFLNILAKTPFYGNWAAQRKREIEVDPKLSGDATLQQVRSLALTEDHPFGMATDQVLIQCLRQNRSNRMAFEYLMAHYLLTRELDSFVRYLPGAKSMSYQEIPTHYEEALLIAQKLKGAPIGIPNINGKTPLPETIQRFERFNDQMRMWGKDLDRAKVGMLSEFGDTYWYYYVFYGSGSALALTDLFARGP